MRKVFLVLASVFALSAANAQTGKNQVGIGVEVGVSTQSGSKACLRWFCKIFAWSRICWTGYSFC